MGNDEQLGLDFEIEQTEWGKWVDSQRRATQVRKLLNRAELPALPSEPWDFESDEAVQISDVIAELFPDIKDAALSESADLLDQLVCFTGEWFVRYLDAQWCNLTDMPSGYNDCKDMSIYDGIKPGIAFKFENWTTCTAELLAKYVIEHEFLDIVELVSVAFWRLRKDGSPLFSELSTNFPDHPPFRMNM
ncbi:hypothetical protein OG874_25500 [Nocardia sp. NBC_00565]|uniref:hypothetical protein n=1 Tax=Nocardia sp. NBC_00565 TaxID=2975993 RepID=UPI002E8038B7|nr:hypothetical protein [Nocardia sp. NBC_00565]WUC00253.1 hypothetical protein OG874_25500 [Nocardia sp. NBC_00565]